MEEAAELGNYLPLSFKRGFSWVAGINSRQHLGGESGSFKNLWQLSIALNAPNDAIKRDAPKAARPYLSVGRRGTLSVELLNERAR